MYFQFLYTQIMIYYSYLEDFRGLFKLFIIIIFKSIHDMHILQLMYTFLMTRTVIIYVTKAKVQPHFQRVAAPDKSTGTKK